MTFTRTVRVQPNQPFDEAIADVDARDLDHTHLVIYEAGAAAAKAIVEIPDRPTEFGASVTITGWSTFGQPNVEGHIGLSVQISRLAPTAGVDR